ncbi:condensation domain-containing protein, partial [Acidobacteriota bacterium]
MSIINFLSRLKELDIKVEVVEDKLKINAAQEKLTDDLVSEIKAKKGEIIRFLQDRIHGQSRYSAVPSSEDKLYYRLSSQQKRLYFLHQLNPDVTVYNVTQAIRLDGDISRTSIEKIFIKLIKRHESLRTSFVIIDEEPVQRVHERVDFSVEYYEAGVPELEQIVKGFSRPFDLSRAPLLRAAMVNGGPSDKLLLLELHHIITDGTSIDILTQDFTALNKREALPRLRLHYRDYAEWQNSFEQQELLKKEQAYWLKTFSDELPVLNLPTDYPRPIIQNFEGDRVYFTLNEDQGRTLQDAAKEAGATLHMSILAVFAVLLSRLSGQEDIIIGIPIAARRHMELENIIGMFVNTLAIRNFPGGGKGFKEFLH